MGFSVWSEQWHSNIENQPRALVLDFNAVAADLVSSPMNCDLHFCPQGKQKRRSAMMEKVRGSPQAAWFSGLMSVVTPSLVGQFRVVLETLQAANGIVPTRLPIAGITFLGEPRQPNVITAAPDRRGTAS